MKRERNFQRILLFTTVCLMASLTGLHGQTCQTFPSTDTPLDIPDGTTQALGVVESVINEPDSRIVTDVNVTLNITHTLTDDLTIELTSPQGFTVILVRKAGDELKDPAKQNFINTVLDDSAATEIINGVNPFTGTFLPFAPLNVFIGENAMGDWTLKVTDDFSDDTGTLDSWSLELCFQEGGVNNPPVARDDTFLTVKNVSRDLPVLANDNDADNDAFSIKAIVTPPTNGTAQINGDQIFYTPAANFFGIDTLSYRIEDVNLATNDATVTITVSEFSCLVSDSVDTPATIPDLNGTQSLSSVINVATVRVINDVNVTLNITHPLIFDLVVTLTSPSGTTVTLYNQNGIFSVNADNMTGTVFDDAATQVTDPSMPQLINDGKPPFTGTFVPFEALSAFNGENTLGDWELTVVDKFVGDAGTLDSWKLELCLDDIDPANTPPIAVNDPDITTARNQSVAITALQNDSDVNNNPLVITNTTSASSGVVVADTRAITYTPATDFLGTATFDYTIEDGMEGSATATVTVNVLETFDSWAGDRFAVSDPNQSSADDFDSDGLSNQFEYLFHLNPKAGNDQSNLPLGSFLGGKLRVVYVRTEQTGFVWRYDLSENLGAWNTATEGVDYQVIGEVTNADGSETVTIELEGSAASAQFVRVIASEQ